MIAVADTSVFCYLILIGEIEILPELFTQVLVPPAVTGELLHEDAPVAVRYWAADLPPWASARAISGGSASGLEKLQAGERDAILLAELIKADVILLDEKSARSAAANARILRPDEVKVKRGSEASMLIRLESPKGREPASLQWDLEFPADSLRVEASGLVAGSAAETAGKSLACAAQKPKDAKVGRYRCILAGGQQRIGNGPVAVVRVRALKTAGAGMR